MNVFDLDDKLVNDYKQFARSFTALRAPDIQAQINQLYESGHFWPEPHKHQPAF